MKRYELKLADGGLGVFKVSVVKDPAIESTLVHFSAEKEEKHFFTDEEKKVIYSVVMRPNMDIFRKNVNGEPANVYYTPETVEQAQINYFRNNGNAATNINHSELADAEGIFPFESWIVTDSKTDRAVKFGLDVQDGDWVMGLKVDNAELWNEHIKTGKLDGFSVEATNINYELKEDVKMTKNKKSIIEKIKAVLFEEEIAEVSKWWQTVTNTTFEIGEVVMRKAYEEGGDDYAASAGEFELEDGRRILTDAQGIIRFIFPAAPDPDAATEDAAEDEAEDSEQMAKDKEDEDAEDAAEAADEAEDAAEDEAEDAAEDAAEETDEDEDEEPTEKEAALLAEIVTLKATIATLKAEKVKDSEELEKMKKQTPAAKFQENLPPPPEVKAYKDMTNAEKMRFNREKKSY